MLILACERHKRVTDENSGEVWCSKCGKVFGTEVVERPISTMSGMPLHPQLGSWIGADKKERKTMLKSLRYANDYDRGLADSIKKIETITRAITSQSIVIKRAIEVFKKTRKQKGLHLTPLAAGSVLYACRENKVPVSIKRIAEVSGIKTKRVTKAYAVVFDTIDVLLPVDKAADKVSQIAAIINDNSHGKFQIPEKTIRKARKIIDSIPSINSGSNPYGIAAATLYLCQEIPKHHEKKPITLRHFEIAIDMTEVGIRSSIRKIKKYVQVPYTRKGKR